MTSVMKSGGTLTVSERVTANEMLAILLVTNYLLLTNRM